MLEISTPSSFQSFTDIKRTIRTHLGLVIAKFQEEQLLKECKANNPRTRVSAMFSHSHSLKFPVLTIFQRVS